MSEPVTLSRADAEAAADALQRHWSRCGGTDAEDDEPLLALRAALAEPGHEHDWEPDPSNGGGVFDRCRGCDGPRWSPT